MVRSGAVARVGGRVLLWFNLALSPGAAAGAVPCPEAEGGVVLTDAPYSALRDGSADTSRAFAAAIADPKVRIICLPPGRYRLDAQVVLRTGQEIELLGLSADAAATRIEWKDGFIAFFSNPTSGVETRIKRFSARNLTFDGNRSDSRAFNLLAAPLSVGETAVELENTVIQNMTNLPVWIEGFSRVRIARTKFVNTKDPGVLRSTNVEIVDNEVINSSDNCLSVSRGNSKVLVARNVLRGCRSAGILVGGIHYEGDRGRDFELDADPGAGQGAKCTIRSPSADYFRYGMIGTHLTLRRGADFVIVRLSGWNAADVRSAPCVLVTTVPASLSRRSTNEWFDGPHFGGGHVLIEDNTIIGTQGHGITLSLGVHHVEVRNNIIRRAGHYVGGSGSTTERPAFGIVVLGWYLGREEGALRYAEAIELRDNHIIDATAGGVRLGSEITGGVRRVLVQGNRIELSSPGARTGVLVARHPQMPSLDNRIVDNTFSFASASSATALRVDAAASEACRALTQATVQSMVNGTCAMRLGDLCSAPSAPATLQCPGKPGRR
jgi:Right handed beta helix region